LICNLYIDDSLMSTFSTPDPVRGVLDADDEMQVGLRAALEFSDVGKVVEYERCMMKVVCGLEKEKLLISEISDKLKIDLIESDIQWKESLLRDLPIGPNADQIKAILTLLKCRPFLGDLEAT
jgi:hypothetical protein